jgi:hypothetical protein
MTKSQRIRFLLRQHWIADESEMTSEEYYNEKMDKYADYLIEKLKEKEEFMAEVKELAKDYE